MGDYESLRDIFVDTPISSAGLRFDETEDEMLGWLAANGMTCADTSGACNWFAAGINLDDDISSYQARVRFGLLLNNENSINTGMEGFGVDCNPTPRIISHSLFLTVRTLASVRGCVVRRLQRTMP
eukprot:COSAG05_NODE_2915_length_2512_cov_4.326564_4_plen_126_part_00